MVVWIILLSEISYLCVWQTEPYGWEESINPRIWHYSVNALCSKRIKKESRATTKKAIPATNKRACFNRNKSNCKKRKAKQSLFNWTCSASWEVDKKDLYPWILQVRRTVKKCVFHRAKTKIISGLFDETVSDKWYYSIGTAPSREKWIKKDLYPWILQVRRTVKKCVFHRAKTKIISGLFDETVSDKWYQNTSPRGLLIYN